MSTRKPAAPATAAAFARLRADWGRLDVLFNNAGVAVYGPVQISPFATDFDVGFIQMPGTQVGRMTPVPSQALFHFRGIALNPTINRGVVNIDAPFSQHFLEFAIADAVFTIPANSPEDDFTLKMSAFEWGHTLSFSRNGALAYHHQIFATVPCPEMLLCSYAIRFI